MVEYLCGVQGRDEEQYLNPDYDYSPGLLR